MNRGISAYFDECEFLFCQSVVGNFADNEKGAAHLEHAENHEERRADVVGNFTYHEEGTSESWNVENYEKANSDLGNFTDYEKGESESWSAENYEKERLRHFIR